MSNVLPVAASIAPALHNLQHLPDLAGECAALDTRNPHAAEHWRGRVHAMLQFSGGEKALRTMLYEVTHRKTSLQARSHGFSNAIPNPGAWLNAVTNKWLAAARTAAKTERK